MTNAERMLYQQVHPLKLLVDVTTSFASAWLLWQHAWLRAAGVAIVPSVLVTAAILWRVDLAPYRDSPLGRYVKVHMTARATAVRIAGQLAMWAGAVAHVPWLLPTGLAVIVFGWLRGLWQPVVTDRDLARP